MIFILRNLVSSRSIKVFNFPYISKIFEDILKGIHLDLKHEITVVLTIFRKLSIDTAHF